MKTPDKNTDFLKKQICNIIDDKSTSLDTSSEKIIDLLLRYRRNKLLEQERNNLPRPNRAIFGGNISMDRRLPKKSRKIEHSHGKKKQKTEKQKEKKEEKREKRGRKEGDKEEMKTKEEDEEEEEEEGEEDEEEEEEEAEAEEEAEEEEEKEGPSVIVSKNVGKEAPGAFDRVVHDVDAGCS